MASWWQVALGLTAAGMVVATPIVYSANRSVTYRNLRVVEDGVLYRSGQLTPEAFERVLHEKQIKTVVSLRTSRIVGKLPPDTWEQGMCESRGLKHVRIVPRSWSPHEDGEIPAEEAIREFLAVMDNKANYPVLVHCFAGIHRTGTMCAIYRMEFQHWTNERAIEEMRLCGFDPLDMQDFIAEYLRAYQPRWKRSAKG